MFVPSAYQTPIRKQELDELISRLDNLVAPARLVSAQLHAARRLFQRASDKFALMSGGVSLRVDTSEVKLSHLQNMVSACSQWVPLVCGDRETLGWIKDGESYVLQRGHYRPSRRQAGRGLFAEAPLGHPTQRRVRSVHCWRRPIPDQQHESEFVRGVRLFGGRGRMGMASALATFRQTGQLYPRYAWAPSLAMCTRLLLSEYCYSTSRPGDADMDQLRREVSRCDDKCYSHLIAQGIYRYHRHMVQAAIRHFEAARGIYPHYYAAWKWSAEARTALGETDEALKDIHHAQLNPDGNSPLMLGMEAYILIQGGRPIEAVSVINAIPEEWLDPKTCAFGARARYDLAMRALDVGREDIAADELLKAESLLQIAASKGERGSLWLLTELLFVYRLGEQLPACQRAGFPSKARRVERRLEGFPLGAGHPGQDALRYVALCDHKSTLRALEQAVTRRDALVVNMGHDPRYAALRRNKRFRELWREVQARFQEKPVV